MTGQNCCYNRAEVRCYGHVSAFVQGVRVQSVPAPEYFAAGNVSAQDPHNIAVSMVSTFIAILMGGSAELGHHDRSYVVTLGSQSPIQISQSGSQRRKL